MKNTSFVLCIALLACVNQAFGSEAGMPQLDPKFWISQIFWLTLIFLTLYLIVSKIFLPKITLSIENRKSRIVDDLDQAQKLKENAEKKLIEYKKIIEEAKKEAKKIIEEGKKVIDNDIEQKKKKFNDEIEKELHRTELEIKSLKKNSLSKIQNIAEETSAEIIKQVINVEVNKSNVSAIVNDISKKEVEKNI